MAGQYDPYAHADQLGIDVIHRKLRTANGFWYPDHNLIVIRQGMRTVHDRSALAHELAHAHLGHRDSSPKHEKTADRLAAGRLINAGEALAVCQWTDDPAKIAAELGVSLRLWRVWFDTYGQELGHLGEGIA
jgi:Zn-dependent peptidase ImmA (M78 family)